MKNENEFWEDGKLYLRSIKRCICTEKCADRYVLSCKIHQRGTKDYLYTQGDSYLQLDCSEKRFWLTEEAMRTVTEAIEKLEALVERAHSGFVAYYRRHPSGRYDCLLSYKNKSSAPCYAYFEERPLDDILREAICFADGEKEENLLRKPTRKTIVLHPFYLAAAKCADAALKDDLLLHYRLASAKDCARLSRQRGRTVLPPLPAAFDREYFIEATDEAAEVLFDSGYKILHQPIFGMQHRTYEKWTVNPHTKIGADYAPEDAKALTLAEYLALF